MTLPLRLPALGPRTKVALGLAAAFLLLLILFDWNWFRPLLERHLSESSRRQVRATDLHVSLEPNFQPTVRLRGVDIENAPWADTRKPFARAGEVSFTFDWRSLLDGPPVVTRLVLRNADIDLERQADGLRNWRLQDPDDRGPPRVYVRTLEAHDSRVRFVDQRLKLDIQTASRPLATPDGPYTQRLDFSGRFQGAPFTGAGDASAVLSFRDSGQFFSVRGHGETGRTRLEVEGRVADLFKLAGVDAELRVAGPSLAQLHPFLQLPLPASKPYRAQGKLKKDGEAYDIEAMKIALGESDLSGTLHYDEKSGRPTVRARLRSDTAALADLGTLVGGGTLFDEKKMVAAPGAAASAAPARLLPAQKLPIQTLKEVDAQVDLAVRRFKVPGFEALTGARFTAWLDQGMLDVAPFELDLAGGRLSGRLALDSRQQPALGRVDLKLRNARLSALLPELPKEGELDGPLQGTLKLAGRGDSLAALLDSVDGNLLLTLDGGRISSGLDARLGLNGGKLLRHFFRGDEPVPIRCGTFAMDFRKGVGTTRRLVLDTAQTHVEGAGHLALDDEQFEFLLTPQAQKAAIALNSSIRVRGSARGLEVELAERAAQRALPGCAAGRSSPA
jgi:uncharacterized protein involved in outer membrane biogenesis